MHCCPALHAQRNRIRRGVLNVNTTQKDINELVTALAREALEAGANINDVMSGLEDSKADALYISAQQDLEPAA